MTDDRSKEALNERGIDPVLPRLKGRFPFRLAATSYILPAPILPNVRFLGPHVDEVELVLFESGSEENLPSRAEIDELGQLGRNLRLTYNVHLPADAYFGDPDPAVRKRACDTTLRFYRRTQPLEPTCYILHLDRRGADGRIIQDKQALLRRFGASLGALTDQGVDPSLVAIENLDYPFEWIAPLIRAKGMKFCLDLGHLLFYGYEPGGHLSEYLAETAMVHFHGVSGGRDHRGLEAVPAEAWEKISFYLDSYEGGLSIEVFSFEDLKTSMARLEDLL